MRRPRPPMGPPDKFPNFPISQIPKYPMSLRKFIIGLIASFGPAWLLVVVVPFIKMSGQPAIPLIKAVDGAGGIFFPKRAGRIVNGAKIYGENGCYLCHTQVVRPTYAGNDLYHADWGGLARDPERGDTRRETLAQDFEGESFASIGSTRTGPDLSNLGRRLEAAVAAKGSGDPAAWLYAHLYDPRRAPALRKSTCPAFRFLFIRREITGQASAAALPFGGTATTELVPGADAKALVSYLLSLKKDHAPPAALNFSPHVKPPAPR
jgi:cytochrome c oxidase cbb3-type subunit 2